MSKKQKKTEEIPLDSYEKELKRFLDKGVFVRARDFSQKKIDFPEAAKRYLALNESKSVTFRIKTKDLIKLKSKAARNNIAYQTLISLLINNYTEGKTKLTL